jgi:hypothetical protein
MGKHSFDQLPIIFCAIATWRILEDRFALAGGFGEFDVFADGVGEVVGEAGLQGGEDFAVFDAAAIVKGGDDMGEADVVVGGFADFFERFADLEPTTAM